MARIGIFSGTFDPVHAGHIAFCRAALREAGLDRVTLLPDPKPRNKPYAAGLAHRVAMLELAVQDEPQLDVLPLPGGQFSVQATLPELERLFPGDELYLLLGSDVVHTFSYRWPGLETLLGRMQLVIGVRGRDTPAGVAVQLRELQQQFPTAVLRYQCVRSPHAAAASTQVRRSLAAPELLPGVAAYITAHGLYTFA